MRSPFRAVPRSQEVSSLGFRLPPSGLMARRETRQKEVVLHFRYLNATAYILTVVPSSTGRRG